MELLLRKSNLKKNYIGVMLNAVRAEHIALFDSKLNDLLDNQNGKNGKFLSKQEYQEILDSLEKWEDLYERKRLDTTYPNVTEY